MGVKRWGRLAPGFEEAPAVGTTSPMMTMSDMQTAGPSKHAYFLTLLLKPSFAHHIHTKVQVSRGRFCGFVVWLVAGCCCLVLHVSPPRNPRDIATVQEKGKALAELLGEPCVLDN